jgi:uncharacterized YccA/Bax inhibitor family protein
MRFRGENPVFKNADFSRAYDQVDQASYGGVTTKTTFLLGIIAVVAMYMAYRLEINNIGPSLIIGLIVAPIVAIIMVVVTNRNPQIAFITATIYALCEGALLGIVSGIFAYAFGGEIIQMALFATFGVLAGMLFLYSTGIVRVGPFFRRLMFSMLIGLVFTGLVLLVLALAGVAFQTFETLYLGIIVISVIVSSLYLLIDFDNITQFVEAGAPKNMEWSLALGLVATIVWLYIELLRLIAILASRNN